MTESGEAAGAVRVAVTTSLDLATATHARTVLDAGLSPEERDDRFADWPTEGGASLATTGFVAALASLDDRPIGCVAGQIGSGGRLQLDALVAPAGNGATVNPATILWSMLDALRPHLDGSTEAGGADRPPEVELWAKPARPWHADVAERLGLRERRALHQMRCSLPVAADPLPTRAYTSDDFEALLAVNNRAFSGHPDQGEQSAERFRASMAEPWFRMDGVRLHEREDRLAGFCWTKIHPSPPAETALGEIYVIGVDPDFHGQGLGVPMTASGLAWLAEQGLEVGMLYVEADNVPAIKTYERLGFEVLRTDRAWLWRPSDGAPEL